MKNVKPLKIFLSYSHKDREYKDTLLKHLNLLVRKNIIEIWNDENIMAGENWQEKISRELNSTDAAILLVSSDYLASDYINDFEIPKLIEKNKKGETSIVPVLIRPTFYQLSEISNYQGLPKGGKTISHWSNSDEAWISVVRDLSNLFDNIIEQKNKNEKITDKETQSKNQIKNLVSSGRIDKALEELRKSIDENKDGEKYNSLLAIHARFEHLRRSSTIGIISHHDEAVERSKITYSLLNLIDDL